MAARGGNCTQMLSHDRIEQIHLGVNEAGLQEASDGQPSGRPRIKSANRTRSLAGIMTYIKFFGGFGRKLQKQRNEEQRMKLLAEKSLETHIHRH